MSATIYKFDEAKKPTYEFPDFLFIDTSFLMNVFLPWPEKIKSYKTPIACSDFLDILKKKAESGSLCLFTNCDVLNEFFYNILKNLIENDGLSQPHFNAYKKKYKENGRNPISELIKDHPELISKYYGHLKCYYDKIAMIPIGILEPEHLISKSQKNIAEAMCNLIKKFSILPADALHIAIAQQAGIDDFVAIDCDFHRVDGINVYTCLSDKPRKCSICK
jgi:hypothetical protein